MQQPIVYSDEQIVQLLERAEALGLNLEAGSDLEELTIAQLDALVSQVGQA